MTIREAAASDAPCLQAMLLEAMYWRPGPERPPAEDLHTAAVMARYVGGWPRAGDGGVIAEIEGRCAGAAWYRRFDASEHSYGYVADDVPEVSIGVAPEHRRQGMGRALLRALADDASAHGYRALSLSVEPDNYAAQLYLSEGYVVVGSNGGSDTMLLRLEEARPRPR